jgi:hypothetical protein
MIKYTAYIKDKPVTISGKTTQCLIRKLKKMSNINLKTTHNKQAVFSEFRPCAWGMFFYRKDTYGLDAWIEFELLNGE